MQRALTIRHEGLNLAATIHYPSGIHHHSGEKKWPVIVITHGFVGSRVGVDRLFVLAAAELAAQGNLVIRFDFAGCGESDGVYGEHGIDSMIEQTRTVLDYALALDIVDPCRVTLLGHSLGGAVALLTAVRDRRVKSLILWAPVGYPFNDILRIVGRSTYDEAVTKGSSDYLGYELKPSFFDALLKHQPFQETQRFLGDVLLVHGTGDDTIPVDYTFLLEKTFWLRGEGRCEKVIIFQADHTFSRGEYKKELFKATTDWIASYEQRQTDWQHWSI